MVSVNSMGSLRDKNEFHLRRDELIAQSHSISLPSSPYKRRLHVFRRFSRRRESTHITEYVRMRRGGAPESEQTTSRGGPREKNRRNVKAATFPDPTDKNSNQEIRTNRVASRLKARMT